MGFDPSKSSDPPAEFSPASVVAAFSKIPELLARDPALTARGRWLDVDCLLGPTTQPFHVAVRAYRATPAAFAAYWQRNPPAGWHDLLALTKRGQATLEGDLHPFMTHLQYFKDLLALPRHNGFGSAS